MAQFGKKMQQKEKNISDYSVIILAAGKSSRMGIPKWSLQFDKNTSFIEHITNEYYRFGCKEIILVINETDYSSFIEKNYNIMENFKIVINKYPEWDRFYTLKLGVSELEKVQTVFIHNVDNPFVNPVILSRLIENSAGFDVIVPEYEGRGGHPILISPQIIQKVISTKENILHFKEFMNQFSKNRVKTDDDKILININSATEYQSYFKF